MAMKRAVQAHAFEFVRYQLQPKNKRLDLHYRMHFSDGHRVDFTEKVFFNAVPQVKNVPTESLREALIAVHLMLGVSYYKLYAPRNVIMRHELTRDQSDFWTTVYRKGLGEFFYRNGLDLKKSPVFPATAKSKSAPVARHVNDRALLGVGGGKDSIVSLELLKEQKFPYIAFTVETGRPSSIVKGVIKTAGTRQWAVRRQLDEKLFQPLPGSLNGHVPISGIIASLGYLSALLFDYRYVIVSNEQSSNSGNLTYRGLTINHQWSKTSEFEELFQRYTREHISREIVYFSLLRPLYEIRIAELFSRYPKYFPVFSSCNKSFKVTGGEPACLWCGECPKCTFVFLMLAAFLPKKSVLSIFGKNLFNNTELISSFKDVLGFGKLKPFDCVGTFEEARAALVLAAPKFSGDLVVKTFLRKIKNWKELLNEAMSVSDAPTTPPFFRFAVIKNTLLLGYGREGKVSERFLRKYFPRLNIGIADATQGPRYLEKQKKFEYAVRTPGLPKQLVTVPYTTATNIFFSRTQNKVIGVTGTKGKSTTASLIYWLLKTGGIRTRLVGNIGKPMLELLQHSLAPDEVLVIELSSYQLDDLEYSPHVAVVTNLFPEHMTYHGGLNNYFAAKKNIINRQSSRDFFVYNQKDKQLKQWARESAASAMPFVQKIPVSVGTTALLGRHNQENMRAAVTVARLFGVKDAAIRKGLQSFTPLPHRLQNIGTYKKITFYDDAISTTPESTMLAIETLKKVDTIFLGGEDRGYDFKALEKALRTYGVNNIVLFPDTGRRILKSERGFNVLHTRSMQAAVIFAYAHTRPGRICLLSTASPSYSLWKDFEEKGALFQRWVKRYGRS
jgi:UDP-N-acetylmuramoylalanine--D-glutamate ligase